MLLGIDPKVDYAFKKLYGQERNRPILESLVRAVLSRSEFADVSDLEILNPFNDKETSDDKLSIVDLRARDRSGRLINIEMQMLAFKWLAQRLLYYWAKSYSLQLGEGEDYSALRPTISICFLNGILFPDTKEAHSTFRLIDSRENTLFSHDIEMHLLQLPKFKKTASEVVEPLDQWLFFLRDASQFDPDNLPACLTLPSIHSAVKELKMLTQDALEIERYEARLKDRRDRNAIMQEAQAMTQEAQAMTQEAQAMTQEAQAMTQEAQAVKQEAHEIRQQAVERLCRTIRMCQKLLSQPQSPLPELMQLPMSDLERQSDELETQVLQRA